MRVACAAMAKKVYVIGGNIREAHEFIMRRGLTGCVPVDDPEALRGCTRPEVIVTGTFIARADVQSFYDVFRETGATHRFSP
jgi:hypothetical protein